MKKRAVPIIMNIVSVMLAVIMLFPILWIMLNSFKPETEIFAKPITLLPKVWTGVAYSQYLVENNIIRAYMNTFIVASASLVVGMIFGVCSAYGLARFKMRTSRLVLILFLVTQMLPSSLMLTPLYLNFSKIRLLNTYWAPILAIATISIPFVVVITRPFFLNLPTGIDDAARIDGCNAFTAFIRVMLPIAKSGIVTAAALAFIFGWNDLMYNMTFNTKVELRPLTSIIYNLMPKEGIKWAGVMALATASVVPIIILFLVLQNYIISGLAAGAVKE